MYKFPYGGRSIYVLGPCRAGATIELYPKPRVLLQEAALRQYGIQEADERFRLYAKECVEEWAAKGRDTKPMELYLTAATRSAPFMRAS